MSSVQDIEHRFAFHAATTQEKRDEHTSVRAACRDLALKMQADMPEGHEKECALTKIEEAMFWANAAIARGRG